MGKFGLVFLLLVAAPRGESQNKKRLIIDVYLEALCPDSLNFIKNQLYPSWKLFRNYVDIRFIPFGKSQSFRNGENFHCQHGQRECEGNKMMSCVLNQLDTQDEQMRFVNCFMNVFKRARQSKNEFGQKCIQELNLNWNVPWNCYNSQVGTNLQLKAEIMTNKIRPTFVPTIVYDGVFDQDLQEASLRNIHSVLCSLLSEDFSVEC